MFFAKKNAVPACRKLFVETRIAEHLRWCHQRAELQRLLCPRFGSEKITLASFQDNETSGVKCAKWLLFVCLFVCNGWCNPTRTKMYSETAFRFRGCFRSRFGTVPRRFDGVMSGMQNRYRICSWSCLNGLSNLTVGFSIQGMVSIGVCRIQILFVAN